MAYSFVAGNAVNIEYHKPCMFGVCHIVGLPEAVFVINTKHLNSTGQVVTLKFNSEVKLLEVEQFWTLQRSEVKSFEVDGQEFQMDSIPVQGWRRKYNIYDYDSLKTGHNHSFMQDEAFKRAYARGEQAYGGRQKFGHEVYWRAHIALWAGLSASKLYGDFVECGTGRGFMASAIMTYINWNSLGKRFYLMDTFSGPDFSQYDSNELLMAGLRNMHLDTGFYVTDVKEVEDNFSEWRNIVIIKGRIPETLPLVDSNHIAFLHIDLNCAEPEVQAINYFWDYLVRGAFVLFDDFAYQGYDPQHDALTAWAKTKNVEIVSLPTGQGLLIKTGRI